MLKWVAGVWKNIHFKLKIKTALVLDNAITHKIIKVKDKIKECENALSVISSGLTSRQQSSDISINKVFKESLRNKYFGLLKRTIQKY